MNDFLKQLLRGGAREGRVEIQAVRAGPEIAARMRELHEALDRDLSEAEVTGEAGGGMVRVRIRADGTPKGVEISPDLHAAEMREPLEDLLLAALQDAQRRVSAEAGRIRTAHMEKVSRLMEGVMRGAGD